MAVAVGCYSLTPQQFPSEFENVFIPRSQSRKEKRNTTGVDGQRRIGADEIHEGDDYPGIGELSMEFNGTHFFGAATIIANGSCVLTSAHNVVEYDQITKEFVNGTNGWFELRKIKAGSGSVLMKQYKVTKTAVYPKYFEYPTSGSGFDLALCWIHVPEDDDTVKELYSKYKMPTPLVREYAPTSVAVVGAPPEHKREKWGMAAQVPRRNIEDWKLDENREIFVYQFFDTSPGESGSPFMGMKPSEILGVHVGGSALLKKYWATAITSAKLQWIAESLGRPWRVRNDNKILYLCGS